MAAANDLRKGMAIRYNGNPAIVLEVQHRTPGNLRAFVQAIIRYIGTGKSADVRFGSTDKVETVDVSRQELEFSYKDTGLPLHGSGELRDDHARRVARRRGEGLSRRKPEGRSPLRRRQGRRRSSCRRRSSSRSPNRAEGVRGDSANNVQKPAKLETGKTINVPLFIKEGEMIKVDTAHGNYMGRA